MSETKDVWNQVKSQRVAWEKGDMKDRVSSNKVVFFSLLPLFFPFWLLRSLGKLSAVNSFWQSNDNSGADGRAINNELDEWQCPSQSLDQAEIFPWIAFSNNKNTLHFYGPSTSKLPRVHEFPNLHLCISLWLCKWGRNDERLILGWEGLIPPEHLSLFSIPPSPQNPGFPIN